MEWGALETWSRIVRGKRYGGLLGNTEEGACCTKMVLVAIIQTMREGAVYPLLGRKTIMPGLNMSQQSRATTTCFTLGNSVWNRESMFRSTRVSASRYSSTCTSVMDQMLSLVYVSAYRADPLVSGLLMEGTLRIVQPMERSRACALAETFLERDHEAATMCQWRKCSGHGCKRRSCCFFGHSACILCPLSHRYHVTKVYKRVLWLPSPTVPPRKTRRRYNRDPLFSFSRQMDWGPSYQGGDDTIKVKIDVSFRSPHSSPLNAANQQASKQRTCRG